jgi:hypothetical protein
MFVRKGKRGDIEHVMHEFQLAQEVILCNGLDRAYVVVANDAVVLAERLAVKATERSGWPIRVTTREQLDAAIAQGVAVLQQINGVDGPLAELLVGEGVLSLDDLAGIAPTRLAEFARLPFDQAERLIKQAKEKSSG